MLQKVRTLGSSSTRRSFLRTGLAAPGVIGTALIAERLPSAAFAASGLTSGDASILRFLSALEILETDLWQQYNELGGIQDQEVPGGSGNKPYTQALSKLDADMPQYIHDNTEDEFTHFNFINAYLVSKGAEPANLDRFRTLQGSTSTGAQNVKRLTNLMQLTVDTSWWTRYRSRTKNPDFGDTFPPAIPGLIQGKFPAIPRSDADLTPRTHLQAIANTAAFHFGTIEQGSTSLYPALAQRVSSVEVLRIAQHRSDGGPALPGLARQGGQRACGDRSHQRARVSGPLKAAIRGERRPPSQPDHARTDRLPEPQLPGLLDRSADRDARGRDGGSALSYGEWTFHRPIEGVLRGAERAGDASRPRPTRSMTGRSFLDFLGLPGTEASRRPPFRGAGGTPRGPQRRRPQAKLCASSGGDLAMRDR